MIREYQVSSALSSPLTSLSSLAGDHESITPFSIDGANHTQDDVNIAQVGRSGHRRQHVIEEASAGQMLCDMQLHSSSSTARGAGRAKSRPNGVDKTRTKTVKVEPQEDTLQVRVPCSVYAANS